MLDVPSSLKDQGSAVHPAHLLGRPNRHAMPKKRVDGADHLELHLTTMSNEKLQLTQRLKAIAQVKALLLHEDHARQWQHMQSQIVSHLDSLAVDRCKCLCPCSHSASTQAPRNPCPGCNLPGRSRFRHARRSAPVLELDFAKSTGPIAACPSDLLSEVPERGRNCRPTQTRLASRFTLVPHSNPVRVYELPLSRPHNYPLVL